MFADERLDQCGLADPRLTSHADKSGHGASGCRGVKLGQFGIAPHDLSASRRRKQRSRSLDHGAQQRLNHEFTGRTVIRYRPLEVSQLDRGGDTEFLVEQSLQLGERQECFPRSTGPGKRHHLEGSQWFTQRSASRQALQRRDRFTEFAEFDRCSGSNLES